MRSSPPDAGLESVMKRDVTWVVRTEGGAGGDGGGE